MRSRSQILFFLAGIAALFLLAIPLAHAQFPARAPWVSSKVRGTPEPPPPFVTEPAFPSLRFNEPIELVAIPGTDRLMLAEHAGKIYTFPNRNDVSTPDLLVDMRKVNPGVQEVYSIAFHPGFATNRYVYIWYILKAELPDGTQIARFKLNNTEPPALDVSSEKTVFTWKSGGHNGGSICFGNDGMLYISTGDGEGPSPPDLRNTGQDITDLLGSILRIEVDGEEPGRTYRIPKDNPFINTPGARPEIWAFGLRNPWRMSVDPVSGDIWTADVGWELWELVHKVERGANYGWSLLEGSKQPVKPFGKAGPGPITPPVVEHPHSEASSITGGYVYRGKKFPELAGSYVYGDFDTGKMWELRYENKKVIKSREIASTSHKIVTFGVTADKELLIVDFRGSLHRLAPNKLSEQNSSFPRKLSETGIFSSLNPLKPVEGVLPFGIKAERWADFASAQRHIGLPNSSTISGRERNWQFPSNAILAKTYSLEMERGNTNSLRKIETQLLHFTGERWNPYTYKWDETQKDAELMPAAGDEISLAVKDSKAPEGLRQQSWRFNSRAECMRCHNSWLNTVLSFTRQQLDRDFALPGPSVGLQTDKVEGNQLDLFRNIQVIQSNALRGEPPAPLVNPNQKRTENAGDESLEKLARSYLHINCSHCHRENAGGSTTSFMNVEMPMQRAGLIDKIPAQGMFGVEDAKVVAPGQPDRSMLYLRMAKTGAGHMPHLGSKLVDEEGLSLIYDWIRQMKPDAKQEAQSKEFTAKLAGLKEGRTENLKIATTAEAIHLARFLAHEVQPEKASSIAAAIYETSADPTIRDLVERFVPHSKRREVLGAQFDVEKLLAVKGNREKGRALFRNESLGLCVNCHKSEGFGRDFGPDLTLIGKKYNRAQVLEHIIAPSKLIEPLFAGFSVELKDETSITGIVIKRSDTEILIKDNTGKEMRLPMINLQKITPMEISIMPEGLFQSLTAQDAADLLEYLASEK